MPVRWRGCDI